MMPSIVRSRPEIPPVFVGAAGERRGKGFRPFRVQGFLFHPENKGESPVLKRGAEELRRGKIFGQEDDLVRWKRS
jgi:hypothetical protein